MTLRIIVVDFKIIETMEYFIDLMHEDCGESDLHFVGSQ